MNKLFLIGVVSMLLVTFTMNIIQTDSVSESVEGNIYQGPVPQGYDLEHFRETGETKRIGEVIN